MQDSVMTDKMVTTEKLNMALGDIVAAEKKRTKGRGTRQAGKKPSERLASSNSRGDRRQQTRQTSANRRAADINKARGITTPLRKNTRSTLTKKPLYFNRAKSIIRSAVRSKQTQAVRTAANRNRAASKLTPGRIQVTVKNSTPARNPLRLRATPLRLRGALARRSTNSRQPARNLSAQSIRQTRQTQRTQVSRGARADQIASRRGIVSNGRQNNNRDVFSNFNSNRSRNNNQRQQNNRRVGGGNRNPVRVSNQRQNNNQNNQRQNNNRNNNRNNNNSNNNNRNNRNNNNSNNRSTLSDRFGSQKSNTSRSNNRSRSTISLHAR